MLSYRLIKGTDQDIESFEQEVSDAIEDGYLINSDLIVKSVTDSSGKQELVFLQSLVFEEDLDLDEDFFVEEEAKELEH
jgi:hypothetical protein